MSLLKVENLVKTYRSGGVLFGDADSMAEQAEQFASLGVSELTVALPTLDDVLWFNENVISAEGS